MPALGDDFGRLSGAGHGFLWLGEAAGGLDGDSADDRFTAADAAEHAAVAVAFGADVSFLGNKRIVVITTPRGGHAETGAVLKGENRR